MRNAAATALLLLCSFSSAFVPRSQRFLPRILRSPFSSQIQPIPNHGHSTTPSINLAVPTDDDDRTADEPLSTLDADEPLSTLDTSRILAYRASLFLVAISIVTTAALSFLDTAHSLPDVAAATTRTALLSCAAALLSASWPSTPLPSVLLSVDGSALRWTGVLPLAAAAVAHDLHEAAPVLAGGTALLALREIWYYGLAYKVEAAGAVVAGVLACVTQEDGVVAVWGGLLGVLAFGKVFEPLRSDQQPTFSEFLGDNPME
mmetsp:Transcript_40322/g.78867  ORF Transcript_40322/g.78867 Transcript_40322/m.78867 type:complete len:261 (+) Transcript_40322:48-830(+)